MKKTWIKIKRGILEPKHRSMLGSAWFLYFYMLDKTNWDDGIIREWTDASAAEELEMPIRTLRDQRISLQDNGYISCLQKRRYQEIAIHNWTNPREYSGELYNKSEQGDTKSVPTKAKGDTKGDIKGSTQHVTLTYISQNHIPHTKEPLPSNIFTIYEQEFGIISKMVSDQLMSLENDYPAAWFKPAFEEAVKNNKRSLSYVIAILKRWKIEGFQSKKVKADGIYQELQVL